MVPKGRERAPALPPWEWRAPLPIRALGREWQGGPDALTNGIAGPGWAVRVGVARGRVWASLWGVRQSGTEVSVERSCGAVLALRVRDTSQCSPIGIPTPAREVRALVWGRSQESEPGYRVRRAGLDLPDRAAFFEFSAKKRHFSGGYGDGHQIVAPGLS